MTPATSRKPLVLAVYFNTHGFGYALFEDVASPTDWGIKKASPRSIADRTGKARALLKVYRPSELVLQDCEGELSRCTARTKKVVDRIAAFAEMQQIEVARYSRVDVRRCFAPYGARTKNEIAHAIANILPEFAPRVPPKRKPWESEAHRMALFDAVALAFTYFADAPLRPS